MITNFLRSRTWFQGDLINILCWICVVFAWLSLFSRVSLWWNEASYYTHGYSVPLLTLVLYLRLRQESSGNITEKKSKTFIFSSLMVLYFFSRILVEPDPFWRLPLWLEMFALSGCSVLLIRTSPIPLSSKSLFLIALYLFTCLPWPAPLESWIVLSLSNLICSVTGESLLLLGYPAEATGSLIRVDQVEIAINNACSGIRSLQNLVSFALFFSIYFRHTAFFFGLSLIIALGLAFFFNSMRALSLSLVSLELGQDIQEQWHDTIGNFFICCSFLCLFFTSWFLGNQVSDDESQGKKISLEHIKCNPFFSKSFIVAIILAELVVFSWFDLYIGESKDFAWHIESSPTSSPINVEVWKVLQFDYGHQQKVKLGNDQIAELIFFGYHESSAAASLCSRNHPPDYCMAHAGLSLIESPLPVVYKTVPEPLTFRHYISERNSPSHPIIHVFWCSATADSRISNFEFDHPTVLEKLMRFLQGKLSYKRQVILVSISGKQSIQEAQSDLFKVLKKVISRK